MSFRFSSQTKRLRLSAAIAAALASIGMVHSAHALTWGTFGSWDTQARKDAADAAMLAVTNRFNIYGDFNYGSDGYIDVYYNAGVPTAQSGYYGSIDFGGTYPAQRVAQHETNHWLGSGTYYNWYNMFDGSGGWTGAKLSQLIQQFDGDGARIYQSGVHYYPYGLNYDSEVTNDSIYMRNVAIMYAMRQDMGNGNPNNPWSATNVTLAASDPAGYSAFNWFGGGWSNASYQGWNDKYFAHAGAAYSTGAFDIRTPQGYPSWTFAGDSLTVNSGGRFLFNGWGTTGVVTVPQLILSGGIVRHDQFSQDLFQLAGTTTLTSATTSTIDAANGSINIIGTVAGAGSMNKIGGYTLTLTGANTFTGDVNLNVGTLIASRGNNLLNPTSSALGNPQVAHNININNGTTLQFAAGDTFGGADTTVVSTLVINAGGTVTNAGNNFTTLGPVQLNGGTLTGTGGAVAAYQMYNLRGTVTVGGTVASTISGSGTNAGYHLAAPTTFNVADVATGTDLTVSGNLLNQDATHGGAGALTKTGLGTMVLSGANTYTGNTNINAGTLAFTSAQSNIGPVTVANNAALRVAAAGASSTTLTSTTLTLGTTGPTSLTFDFNSLDTTAPLISTGVFTANGTVNLTMQNGGVLTTGSHKLVGYTSFAGGGTFTGSPFTLGPRSTGTLVNNGTNALNLNVVADRPIWTGADNGNWQTASTGSNKNWKLQTAATITDYLQGDNVLFDDTATGSTIVSISTASVSPAAMTFNNTTKNYTITSAGGFGVAGTGTLTKSGTGTLTINTTNSFSGGTTVNAGTLISGNASSLGTGGLTLNGAIFGNSAATTISGILKTTGNNTIGYAGQNGNLTFNGGLSGTGTVTNYVGSNTNANVFFNGDLSGFTGTINYTCDTGTAAQWWRVGANNSIANLSNATLVINKGNLTNLSTIASKNFGFTDGISSATVKIGALSGDGVFQASYNNAGPNTLEVGNLNTNTTFSGVIAGGNAGTNMSLTKVGTGTLTLSGTNLYAGTTTINAGTVSISANSNLGADAAAVTLNSATLKTTNTTPITNTHAITVGSGGTLNIAGNGAGTTNQGDRIIFATANTLLGSGPLTVTGAGTLAGAAPNTTTAGAGALVINSSNTYGGALTLQNGGMLEYANGSALGSGASIILGNEGELSVTNAVTAVNAVTVSGGTNSVLSFTNAAGTASGPIAMNANLTVALRNWYNYAGVQSGTISGVISGAGGITVNSGTGTGGTLTLSAANTFTGNMTVNNATVAATFGANDFTTSGRASGSFGNEQTANKTVTINNGGTVSFAAGNVLGSGGSTIAQAPVLSFVVNTGGVLKTAAPDVGGAGGGDANIFGPITLNGGTFTTGNGYNADYQAAIFLKTVTVGGTSASTINTAATNIVANGIMLGDSVTGTDAITFNVADATSNANADLTVSAKLINSANSTSNTGAVGALTKAGVGTMVLSGVNSYTGNTTVSAGTLTVATAGSILGSTNVSVASGATLNALGALKSGANLTVAGIANIGTGVGTTTSTGQLKRTLGTLSVSSGGVTTLSAAATHAGRTLLEISSLTNTGKLDIADNDLLIHNVNATTLANVVNQIKIGRNVTPGGGFDGSWNGTSGLVSSAVSASLAGNGIEDRSIGYMLVGDYFFGGISSFDGVAVTNTDLIVKYTRNGDADLSGVVDDNDVSLVGAFYGDGLTNHHWYDGDYDGNGKVDDNDVAVLGTFYDLTQPALSAAALSANYGPAFAAAFEAGLSNNTSSAVPEPASLGMMLAGATAWLARRRLAYPAQSKRVLST